MPSGPTLTAVCSRGWKKGSVCGFMVLYSDNKMFLDNIEGIQCL